MIEFFESYMLDGSMTARVKYPRPTKGHGLHNNALERWQGHRTITSPRERERALLLAQHL